MTYYKCTHCDDESPCIFREHSGHSQMMKMIGGEFASWEKDAPCEVSTIADIIIIPEGDVMLELL